MSRSIRLFSIPALVLATAPAALAGYAGTNGTTCAYSSVQAAINAAPAGGTVWIAEGTHSDPGFVLNKDLTLKRATSTCQTGGSSQAVLDFNSAGHAEIAGSLSRVVIQDLTFSHGVGVNGGNLAIGAHTDVDLDNVGLYGGVASGDGGGIHLGAGATLSADGIIFLSNSAEDGGGLYAEAGSSVELSDSLTVAAELVLNDATGFGGGLACNGCSLTTTDLFVTNNTGGSGGGVAVLSGGNASLSGGSFLDNAATYGGGAYVLAPDTVDFTSVDFEGNVADLRGGGLLVDDSTGVTVTDGTFTSNSSGEHGGALYVFTSDVDVEHTRFESNASAAGGAIFVDTETGSDHFITIDRSTLWDNTATGASTGSGIDIRSAKSNVTISNTQVVGGNSPTSPGGAVVAQASAFLTLLDSTVAYNERYGVVSSGATTSLTGVIVWANDQGVYGSGTASCSDIQGSAASTARNISANPLFTDPANADLTLQSASPAKDACPRHVGTSLDNHDRNVGRSDMGAYDHP